MGVRNVPGGKFANGAVTAAMAFAFNHRNSNRGRERPAELDTEDGVCSEGVCVGYYWDVYDQQIGGPRIPKWHGVEHLPHWLWQDMAPPLGHKVIASFLDIAAEHSFARETAHYEYPHIRVREYRQYRDDSVNRTFTSERVQRVPRVYGEEVFYKSIPTDTSETWRYRWRTCLGGCFYWPR